MVTIDIKQQTKDRIDKIKIHPRQTYDEVISFIVGAYENLEVEK